MTKDSFTLNWITFTLHVLHTENNIQTQATPASYDTNAFLSHIHKDTVWNWNFNIKSFRTLSVINVLVFSFEIHKLLKLPQNRVTQAHF